MKRCEQCYLRDAKPCYECNACMGGDDHFKPAPKLSADKLNEALAQKSDEMYDVGEPVISGAVAGCVGIVNHQPTMDSTEQWRDRYRQAALNWQQENAECRKLQSKVERIEKGRDAVVDLVGKLIALCDMPNEWRDKLLRRHINRPGDYMGCGYDFLDAYYRIFDDFMETSGDDVCRTVYLVAEQEMNKWRESKKEK